MLLRSLCAKRQQNNFCAFLWLKLSIGLFLTLVGSSSAAQQAARSAVDGVESFALQLINSSPQQRTELLAARPGLLTVDLRKVLVRRANNRLVHSDYAPALEIYRLTEKIAEQIKDKEGLAVTL